MAVRQLGSLRTPVAEYNVRITSILVLWVTTQFFIAVGTSDLKSHNQSRVCAPGDAVVCSPLTSCL
jgi:hypothetical protein